MPARDPHDWTIGPAKWAAVFLLGGVSALGITASFRAASSGGDGHGPAPMAAVKKVEPTTVAPTQTPPPPPQPLLGRNAIPTDRNVEAAQAPSPERSPAPTRTHATAPTPSLAKINLNTASAAELERLPRIGPAMAKRIIDFRSTRGPFRHIDDLDAVPGIGPRTLEQLRPLVSTE